MMRYLQRDSDDSMFMILLLCRYIGCFVIFLTALNILLVEAVYAWPSSSFDEGLTPYKARRKPIMQNGMHHQYPQASSPYPAAQSYDIAPTARIPSTPANEKTADKRSCCSSAKTPRWYVGFTGFVVFLRDQDLTRRSSTTTVTDTYTTDRGYAWGINAGYRITPTLRAELEYARRENDLESLNGGPPNIPNNTRALQKSNAYMANVYYDFINDSRFTPYLGAGVGMAMVKAPVKDDTFQQFFKERVLAYQFMAGVAYELDIDFNPITFNLGYRYFTGQDAETDYDQAPITGTFFNDSHNLELGGKFYF